MGPAPSVRLRDFPEHRSGHVDDDPDDSPDTLLWSASDYMFRKRWEAISRDLEIPSAAPHGLTPASLRPGGVTSYYLATEDVPRLMRRARWTSAEQLSTYVQEVTPLEFWTKLPRHVQWRITSLASLLPAALELTYLLLREEVPTRRWHRHFCDMLGG